MNDGSNLPPKNVDPLRDRLYEDHKPLLTRRDELDAAIARFPDEIEDEETAGKAADFVNQINEFLKTSNKVFEDEKAPFLAAGRTCDNFKHELIDAIEAGKAKVNKVRKAFADKKADEERRRREEVERLAREEAAKAQRKADEEAEERRKVAAEAQRIADEKAAALAKEEDMQAALDAQAEADRIKAENAKQEEADREEAARLAKVAEAARRDADAKPAQMGKSRGEYGGQTTLKQYWAKADLDRGSIDLESLRPFFTIDAIEKAIEQWIKSNGDGLRQGVTLKGVRIYLDTRL